MTQVALPIDAGNPVERANAAWANAAVAGVVSRCMAVASDAKVQLGWWLKEGDA
jgi:hypothetical protein